MQRKYLVNILKKHEHFYTIEACSLKQALRLLKRESPDIVLLDLGLPDSENRRQTLEVFMIASEIESVPVIVISQDFWDEDLAKEAFRLGAIEFVAKTNGAVKEEDIVSAMEKATDKLLARQEEEDAIKGRLEETQRLLQKAKAIARERSR